MDREMAFVAQINKYRTGYGELSKIVERIQGQFERRVAEVFLRMYDDVAPFGGTRLTPRPPKSSGPRGAD